MPVNTMQIVAAQGLRVCGRALPVNPLASRVVFARHSLFVAPSYKVRSAVRGYATAAATKKKPATKKPAAKKPAAKKTAAKKTTKASAAKKTSTKSKAKKKPVKKAAPKKKKVAKPVDPVKQMRATKRALKQKALLDQPKQLPSTAWMVFTLSRFRGVKLEGNFGEASKQLSADFKNLSSSEMERLSRQAEQNKMENAANYKKWVLSHPVADVMEANYARHRLVRKFNVKVKSPITITDDRIPKRPCSSFVHYWQSQMSTVGAGPEGLKTIASQWKGLSEAEKKPFVEASDAEKVRYKKEVAKISGSKSS